MYLDLFSKVEETINLLIAARQQAEDTYTEGDADNASEADDT